MAATKAEGKGKDEDEDKGKDEDEDEDKDKDKDKDKDNCNGRPVRSPAATKKTGQRPVPPRPLGPSTPWPLGPLAPRPLGPLAPISSLRLFPKLPHQHRHEHLVIDAHSAILFRLLFQPDQRRRDFRLHADCLLHFVRELRRVGRFDRYG